MQRQGGLGKASAHSIPASALSGPSSPTAVGRSSSSVGSGEKVVIPLFSPRCAQHIIDHKPLWAGALGKERQSTPVCPRRMQARSLRMLL